MALHSTYLLYGAGDDSDCDLFRAGNTILVDGQEPQRGGEAKLDVVEGLGQRSENHRERVQRNRTLQ